MDINPAWWRVIAEEVPKVDPNLSGLRKKFLERLGSPECQGFEKNVLEILVSVCCVKLDLEDWGDPFKPIMRFQGNRQWCPKDLSLEESALLRNLAPLMERPDLEARVADISWTYGCRSDAAMQKRAINAYLLAPIDDERSWYRVGRESWQRAVEIAKRCGKSGEQHLSRVSEELHDRIEKNDPVLGSEVLVAYARFLRENRLAQKDRHLSTANILVNAARTRKNNVFSASCKCYDEALKWFTDPEYNNEKYCAMKSYAETCEVEAERLIRGNPGREFVAARPLSKAYDIYSELPKKTRDQKKLDKLGRRIDSLNKMLVESMTSIEIGPIDVGECADAARECVSGVESPIKAISKFVRLSSFLDVDKIEAHAASAVRSSPLAQFFKTSIYARDGRKVTENSDDSEESGHIWTVINRGYNIRIELIVRAAILPAQNVLNVEHRFDRDFFIELARRSHYTPSGCEYLWGSALALGMNGDYGLAAMAIAPLFERVVREALRSEGVQTRLVNSGGIEEEKSLNALLSDSSVEQILGRSLAWELKLLLCDQQGPNLRNEIAHGLVDDLLTVSICAVYLWWFALRFTLIPLICSSSES